MRARLSDVHLAALIARWAFGVAVPAYLGIHLVKGQEPTTGIVDVVLYVIMGVAFTTLLVTSGPVRRHFPYELRRKSKSSAGTRVAARAVSTELFSIRALLHANRAWTLREAADNPFPAIALDRHHATLADALTDAEYQSVVAAYEVANQANKAIKIAAARASIDPDTRVEAILPNDDRDALDNRVQGAYDTLMEYVR